MKITIVAVGKLKERFWKDAVAEYVKRLGAYASVNVVEVPDVDPAKCGGDEKARVQEAVGILKAVRGSHVILLAINGEQYSSEAFATRLDTLMTSGVSEISFVIGGSTGAAASVRERADEMMSFGAITLPHNLARVVLVEQIYRAFKIIRNEPYHK